MQSRLRLDSREAQLQDLLNYIITLHHDDTVRTSNLGAYRLTVMFCNTYRCVLSWTPLVQYHDTNLLHAELQPSSTKAETSSAV